ncbi:MAG: pyridoxamine kinase [Bacillota bacterium]
MQKRALAIHDISCVGRCSLTVALPILSAAGVNTSVIPTALLSTHTGEFTGYTHLDLSDQLLPIASHLQTLKLHFDAFYSGYLASAGQVALLLQITEMLCDSSTQLFVDPAFADHGKLYSHMSDDMPTQMRRLCQKAHTITPNFTEASFLLGKPYLENGYDAAYVRSLAADLAALGPQSVVITDVHIEKGQTGIAVYQKKDQAFHLFYKPLFAGIFYGTGDVFASFLIACMLNGLELNKAAQTALDCTHEAIRLTLKGSDPLRYGVRFELVLPQLIEALKQK